jgi:hypothetical protein
MPAIAPALVEAAEATLSLLSNESSATFSLEAKLGRQA